MKRILFIDRDGTLIYEPEDEQIDSFEKLRFVKGVFRNLGFISKNLDFELVMVSNQDGLGTQSFPEETFWPVHNFILNTLESEGIKFSKIHIDRHFPEDNHPCRKPGIGMLTEYLDSTEYDIKNSYVIGDRETDRQLAENLGCKALIVGDGDGKMTWDEISEHLFAGERIAETRRETKETEIYVRMNLDGHGHCDISTGLGFFDHMLEQIGRHGMIDITVKTKGYLINGHVFDDSWQRGYPEAFRVSDLIEGWQIALQAMTPGDKWKIYIPYQMGYGIRTDGDIPGCSTLIFEMELISIA